jgi:hypothetical protein
LTLFLPLKIYRSISDLRIITVAGSHESGRTSLIHALLFHWGYVLTKEQVVATRIRAGIWPLFRLHPSGILILRCHDVRSATNETGDS